MLAARSTQQSEQCRLVIFPPQIACSQDALVALEDLGRPFGASIFRGHESWSLSHGDHQFGTGSIDDKIPVQFRQPGQKVLVAKVVPPPIGSVYLVQSQLLVVHSEEEELDWLVRHPIDEESRRWFGMMMSRHRGELDWRSGFDALLRRYMAELRDPRNEDVRRRAERARFLAFLLHENLIRKIAWQFFPGDTAAVQDAVHVTSVKFLTLQGKFDPSRECGTYLGKVVRNYCLDQKRKALRETATDPSLFSAVQDPDSPFDSIDEAEHLRFILELLNRAREEGYLTDTEYGIFWDKAAEKRPFHEIADKYQLTSSPDYQARCAAGHRRVREIITKIRQYVGLRNNGKEKDL
jgi:RNA polymerase sigma factor (sigma-70 family)